MKKRVLVKSDLLAEGLIEGKLVNVISFLQALTHEQELEHGVTDLELEIDGDYDETYLAVYGYQEYSAEELASHRSYAEKDAVKRVKSLNNKPEVRDLVYEKLKKQYESQ